MKGGSGKMIKTKQALSIAFEGLVGTGKTTAINKIVGNFSPTDESWWVGHGRPYSVERAKTHQTSIAEWIEYRQKFFISLEQCCDFMLLERCSFNDFSNLCFRKNLVSTDELFALTDSWWPNFIIVVRASVDACIQNLRKRGDVFRADKQDLLEFATCLDRTAKFLSEFLGEKLVVVSDSSEAYEIAMRLIETRRR